MDSLNTTYQQDVHTAAVAAVTMEATGTKGQRNLAAAAARAFIREYDAVDGGMDAKARTKFWATFAADMKSEVEKIAQKKEVDVSQKHSATTVSMVKKVCERDLTNEYLRPWSVDDFTVGLRPAYDALNPKKDKSEPTEETVAKYVRDNAAKYGLDIDRIVALIRGEA